MQAIVEASAVASHAQLTVSSKHGHTAKVQKDKKAVHL